ncbi:MAG: citrate lyase acyl carrier protein [Candidatus Thiodiazotropha sp.]
MLRIRSKAQAGTMQSSDLMVTVEPHARLEIEIESTVQKQFEHLIRDCVVAVLRRINLHSGRIMISDRGALDYAIEARVEVAVRRGAGSW